MTRRLSPHALKLATLLRDLNPDIKFAPAFERALGKKVRTVDVVMPAVRGGKTEAMELDRQIAECYPDLPDRA